MCGFVGFLRGEGCQAEAARALVTLMSDAIAHRGPDDAGAWVDPAAGLAFGHRRLAVLDLSPAGHQPMHSASGRFVIVFNGEIYNHPELRHKIQGMGAMVPSTGGEVRAWQGHSDTETLLAAIETWGVAEALRACVGMFAFALWDRQERTLTLARDRFGEKPLYYGWVRGALVFGSELKALRAYPGFDNPVCREALAQYLRFMYVPAPLSIYKGVYKLEPGCFVEIPGSKPMAYWGSAERPGVVRPQRYWSLGEVVAAGVDASFTDEIEALEALEAGLREAVRLQSLADVPLGAFLSGGVDSSTIVSLMQQQSSRPIRTFTVGFEESGFDESPHARAVAEHLGTDHCEIRVNAAEARAVIPLLPRMYDEPFADSSQIPTHLVCRAARQQVTVALSGDGGDELFGGYNRYLWGPRIWSRVAWMPYRVRQALALALSAVPSGGWDAFGEIVNRLLPGSAGLVRVGEKAHKLGARLGQARSLDDFYRHLVTEWSVPPLDPATPACIDETSASDLSALVLSSSPERMMYWDSMTYLPDDILCKVDRAAMAVSLETRVPFLDHRVAELAWRLPLSMKIRGSEGKWALRKILDRSVPRELIERPKAGFALPVGQWLRGPLRAWAEDLLDEGRLRGEGYLAPEPILRLWEQHLAGRQDWTPKLWSILMFQAWLREGH